MNVIDICDCLSPHFPSNAFSSKTSQQSEWLLHLDRYITIPSRSCCRVRSLDPRKFDGVESKEDEEWKLAGHASLVSHFSQTKLMQYYHRPPSSSSSSSSSGKVSAPKFPGFSLTALCPSKRRPLGRPWSRSASAWRRPAREGCSRGCGRPRRGGGRRTCSGEGADVLKVTLKIPFWDKNTVWR